MEARQRPLPRSLATREETPTQQGGGICFPLTVRLLSISRLSHLSVAISIVTFVSCVSPFLHPVYHSQQDMVFKAVHSVIGDGDIQVKKFKSTETGMTAVIADVPGPIVNGYLV